MKTARQSMFFLLALLLCVVIGGCATGNALTVHDPPSRPAAKAVPRVEGAPAVVVLDFSWEENPSSEIGRDFDNVRPIVWKGNPGKMLADLVAGVLAEKGIPAVRAAGEADIPGGVSTRVQGRVEEFRVNVRRTGMVMTEIDAVAAVKLEGSGPGAPSGWSTSVNSTYKYTEPLFAMSGDVLHAVNRASNAVAEEGVRRLMESGLVAAPPSAGAGGPEPR